jgi:hypothetical protein
MMTPIRSLLFFAFMHVAVHAEEVATLPQAKLLEARASGTLNDGGAVYYAQLVGLEHPDTQQILLFRLDENGKYTLAERSRVMAGMGGSGNWKVTNIQFRNGSLYISFGYAWHQCSGWSDRKRVGRGKRREGLDRQVEFQPLDRPGLLDRRDERYGEETSG